jgi:hypothetical protein
MYCILTIKNEKTILVCVKFIHIRQLIDRGFPNFIRSLPSNKHDATDATTNCVFRVTHPGHIAKNYLSFFNIGKMAINYCIQTLSMQAF